MTEQSAHNLGIRVETLKKRADFLALRSAKTAHSKSFLIATHKTRDDGSPARVGLTVTKKMGGAVVRNRIKRRLRAAIREVFAENAVAGHDYVLIARKAAFDRNYAELLDDMKHSLLRLSRAPK